MTRHITRYDLITEYRQYTAELNRITSERWALQQTLAVDCQHEIHSQLTVSEDNGYGRWWKTTYDVCILCRSKRRASCGTMAAGSWCALKDQS